MATESRPGTESPDGGNTGAGNTGRQSGNPVGQRDDQGGGKTAGPTPAQSAPDAGGDGQRDNQRDDPRESGNPPARESDPAAGRDLPDENGEPPSVKRPGGNPEESEPPVENT